MHCRVQDKAAMSWEQDSQPSLPSLGWCTHTMVHTSVEGTEGALRVSW